MSSLWTDDVGEILAGDQAVALAHVTPANGVVLTQVTNFALQSREAGTIAVNSSVGMWRKLERMRQNPHVAVAFHTRDHSLSGRPEYVLVQGRATVPDASDPAAWLDEMGDHWERFGGQSHDLGRFWNWWLRAYHWRVNVEIAVERVVVWPDLRCQGAPTVYGEPLPAGSPPSQPAPAKGSGPRVDQRRAARRAARLPHSLLGWVGADSFPVVVPVRAAGAAEAGISLETAAGLVPPGGRRAGLLAHWFSRYVVGQRQRRHTGWLDGDELVYAPHTEHGYRLPAWRLAYNIGAGFVTRRNLREARRRGAIG